MSDSTRPAGKPKEGAAPPRKPPTMAITLTVRWGGHSPGDYLPECHALLATKLLAARMAVAGRKPKAWDEEPAAQPAPLDIAAPAPVPLAGPEKPAGPAGPALTLPKRGRRKGS